MGFQVGLREETLGQENTRAEMKALSLACSPDSLSRS